MMRDVMRADQYLDVDAKIVRPAQYLDHASHRPLAVFAKIQKLRGDDDSVQILDPVDSKIRCTHAMHSERSRRQSHVFGNLDPLADAVVVRYYEISVAPDAKLADHLGMRAA